MQASSLEKLIWILIYAGLLSVGLGLAVQRGDAMLGWFIVAVGGITAAIGAVLIVVRARMKTDVSVEARVQSKGER